MISTSYNCGAVDLKALSNRNPHYSISAPILLDSSLNVGKNIQRNARTQPISKRFPETERYASKSIDYDCVWFKWLGWSVTHLRINGSVAHLRSWFAGNVPWQPATSWTVCWLRHIIYTHKFDINNTNTNASTHSRTHLDTQATVQWD